MKKITEIKKIKPALALRKKVAAYCRVSMNTERLNHSLSAQVSRYSELIQSNPEWEFSGIYADSGISGTSAEKRPEFMRMIDDCMAGRIDIILTKSISRFARNTVDLLQTVRKLKDIGVEVRFEEQNINTLSGDGELMLTILASFAQEEIRSISENAKWGKQKGYQEGKPPTRFRILGYRWEGWDLVVVPEEAIIVKDIFDLYLSGMKERDILAYTKEHGYRTKAGAEFTVAAIYDLLARDIYTGRLTFQKTYTLDPITKIRKRNKGELPMYVVENHHEAIIPMETFEKVKKIRAERYGKFYFVNNHAPSLFTKKIVCECCGALYWRYAHHNPKAGTDYVVWHCAAKAGKSRKHCPSKNLPENRLRKALAQAMGTPEFDEERFLAQVDHIGMSDSVLTVYFKNGEVKKQEWEFSAGELHNWHRKKKVDNGKADSENTGD